MLSIFEEVNVVRAKDALCYSSANFSFSFIRVAFPSISGALALLKNFFTPIKGHLLNAIGFKIFIMFYNKSKLIKVTLPSIQPDC